MFHLKHFGKISKRKSNNGIHIIIEYYLETSEIFEMSFPCKRESIKTSLDSHFRGNDRQEKSNFSEVSLK
jgi:hypothetical protein